jgi:hypothetical protein
MKKYPRRASLAMARACSKEARAAIAVAKAIVCWSMETRRLFDTNNRTDGSARAQRRTPDIPAECPTAAFLLGDLTRDF